MGCHKQRTRKSFSPGERHEYRQLDSDGVPYFVREDKFYIECGLPRHKVGQLIGANEPYSVLYGTPSDSKPDIGDGFLCYCPRIINISRGGVWSHNFVWQLVFRFRIPRKSTAFYREMADEERLPRLIKASLGFEDACPNDIVADWLEEHGFMMTTMFMRFKTMIDEIRPIENRPFAYNKPILMARRFFGR
jgi:hypothetical protein